MASSTTYGDWMRPIAGGIRNIGKPLTFAGLGVLVVTLMLSMVNVVAAIATAVIGIGTIAVLAVRDREHRNVLDRTVERRSWLSESRKGRALYRSGMLAPVESGECRLPGILSRVSLVEANDGFGDRLTLVALECLPVVGEADQAPPLGCPENRMLIEARSHAITSPNCLRVSTRALRGSPAPHSGASLPHAYRFTWEDSLGLVRIGTKRAW